MKISNTTITILLVIALALTLTGSFLSLSTLAPFKNAYLSLTGAATTSASGTSTLTISSSTSITNNVASIAFGSGYTNASGCADDLCKMDSNGQHNQSGRCCVGFTNVTSGFLLENTGNINISVNYSCDGSCTAAEFIGGTAPNFSMRVFSTFLSNQSGGAAADTTASCTGFFDRIFNGWNISAGGLITANTPEGRYIEIGSNQNRTLCGNTSHFALNFADSSDEAVIDINVSIPADAPTGAQKTATFTFNAISSG